MADTAIQVIHLDDESAFLELASTFIERDFEDIAVETLCEPEECIDRVMNGSPTVDCIVSDFDMPNRTGLEVLDVVKEHHPDLPFILYTGKGSEEIAAEAISRGVDDYMQKGRGTDQYRVLANRIKRLVEQYRTQQELWNSEERYRSIVEQSIVGIYIIQDYEFTYVNDRLAGIFGYAANEVVGKPVSQLVAPEDRDQVEENLRKRLEDERDSIQYEFTGVHKRGDELHLITQGRRIEIDGESVVSGVLLDLNDIEANSTSEA